MARRLTLSLAAAAAVAFVAVGAPATAAPRHGIRVELVAEKTNLTTTEDVHIRFKLWNTGERGRSVYLWDTPLFEVENDLFRVTRNGEAVAYLGYVAKRGTPTESDYVRLRPGESRLAVVELSSLYEMTQPGVYVIRYRKLPSNEVTLQITGAPRQPASFDQSLAGSAVTAAASTVYRNCTASQQTTLAQVRPAAQNYASESYSSLTGTAGARYTTWFGAYTSTRYNTVKNHYQAISSALNNETITFDCGCKKRYYAYVYPNRPYEIFLCRVFWDAPLTGTDSKAGTIIHETSHFYVVASTDDWTYGQSSCKSLAISDPDKAIDNADSHEYYAENNPPQ